MKQPRMVHSIFAAALASALCWQASAVAAPIDSLRLRATFEPRQFVFEMRVGLFCLRLQGEIPGFIVAGAHLLAYDGCSLDARSLS